MRGAIIQDSQGGGNECSHSAFQTVRITWRFNHFEAYVGTLGRFLCRARIYVPRSKATDRSYSRFLSVPSFVYVWIIPVARYIEELLT